MRSRTRPGRTAPLTPVTVRTADLVDSFAKIVAGDHTPATALAALSLNADQRRILTLAADQPLMEVSFALTIHDARGEHVRWPRLRSPTPSRGRIVTGPILGEDRTWWTQIVPGTPRRGRQCPTRTSGHRGHYLGRTLPIQIKKHNSCVHVLR